MTATTATGGLVRTYTTPAGGGGGQPVRTESDPIAARIRPNVASFLICLPQRALLSASGLLPSTSRGGGGPSDRAPTRGSAVPERRSAQGPRSTRRHPSGDS